VRLVAATLALAAYIALACLSELLQDNRKDVSVFFFGPPAYALLHCTALPHSFMEDIVNMGFVFCFVLWHPALLLLLYYLMSKSVKTLTHRAWIIRRGANTASHGPSPTFEASP